jgi:hypothetical protein
MLRARQSVFLCVAWTATMLLPRSFIRKVPHVGRNDDEHGLSGDDRVGVVVPLLLATQHHMKPSP